jgi:hypothetical protein
VTSIVTVIADHHHIASPVGDRQLTILVNWLDSAARRFDDRRMNSQLNWMCLREQQRIRTGRAMPDRHGLDSPSRPRSLRSAITRLSLAARGYGVADCPTGGRLEPPGPAAEDGQAVR